MIRLSGFDYKSPYYYMVTLKKLKGLPVFSEIADNKAKHYLDGNAVTRLFVDIIKTFHESWSCIEPITCFSIMPDHIHLLIKIKAVERRKSLPIIVWQLAKRLEEAYFSILPNAVGKGKTPIAPNNQALAIDKGAAEGDPGLAIGKRPAGGDPGLAIGKRPTGGDPGLAIGKRPAEDDPGLAIGKRPAEGDPGLAIGKRPAGGDPGLAIGKRPAGGDCDRPHCFEKAWHDWIVKANGQLATFTRYIRENPGRAVLRRKNARYFGKVARVNFLGREWFAYGNRAILDLPILHAFKGHRATTDDSASWQALVAEASRIGPGGAGVSTFMSPLEKACGNAIARAGGKLVVLSPEGFGERWHPAREKERYCANGRMLFLSLYGPDSKKPTKAELYIRSHEMVDLVAAQLPSSEG